MTGLQSGGAVVEVPSKKLNFLSWVDHVFLSIVHLWRFLAAFSTPAFAACVRPCRQGVDLNVGGGGYGKLPYERYGHGSCLHAFYGRYGEILCLLFTDGTC